MRSASLSLVGLYNWNATLFDTMAFPDGFAAEDKQLFVNNVVLECAELEVLYSDWDFLKSAIEVWSSKEVVTWQRIYDLSLMEYNPIENYNRTEKTNVQNRGAMTHSGTDSIAGSGFDSDVSTGYNSIVGSGNTSDVGTGNTSDVSSGTDTVTHSVTSFDSNTYQPKEQTTDGKGTTVTHNRADTVTHNRNDTETHNLNSTVTHNHGTTDTTTYGHTITDSTGSLTQSTISGNIGTMTSQQMAEQEISLAPKLNIINIMVESFKNRFCLLVY